MNRIEFVQLSTLTGRPQPHGLKYPSYPEYRRHYRRKDRYQSNQHQCRLRLRQLPLDILRHWIWHGNRVYLCDIGGVDSQLLYISGVPPLDQHRVPFVLDIDTIMTIDTISLHLRQIDTIRMMLNNRHILDAFTAAHQQRQHRHRRQYAQRNIPETKILLFHLSSQTVHKPQSQPCQLPRLRH